MKSTKSKFQSIDDYIGSFPKEDQVVLQKIRHCIQKAAPEATEAISYQMPTFKLYGNLVHFADFKNHFGIYPGASGVKAFKEDLSLYKTSKGAIQFPKKQPIPFDLISRIVGFKAQENLDKDQQKRNKRRTKASSSEEH